MQLTNALFRQSYLIFLAFFGLVIWGFWNTYYGAPWRLSVQSGGNFVAHLHGLSMTLWCLMLVTQAYLIRAGHRSLHRRIGKSSYLLAPFMVIVQLVGMKNIVSTLDGFTSAGQVTDAGAVFMAGGLGMPVLFAGLYLLAIHNRKDPAIHARLMVATILPIVTPATDRITRDYFPGLLEILPRIPGIDGMNEIFVGFALADIAAIVLVCLDWRSRKRLNVFLPILVALLAYQVFTCVAHHVEPWRAFSGLYLGL
jgi:hypothetical protein